MSTTTERHARTDRPARSEAELQQMAKDHLWMHFARQSVMTEGPGVPIIVRGEGHHIWDSAGKRYIDGLSGLFVVNAGHGRKRLAEAAAPPGRAARVLPDLVVCAPGGDRARRPARRLRARRPQPRVLLHRRRRGRRDRVQARQALLEAAGQAAEAQGHLALHRLPRHPAGRARDHGPPRHEVDVRAGHPRRLPRAEHQLLPRRRDGLRRAASHRGVRRLGGRPHRGDDQLRGPRHHRRGVPRAGAELRRLLPPASRLLPARARDLRQVRRAARVATR